MDAIMDAVNKDYNEWLNEKTNTTKDLSTPLSTEADQKGNLYMRQFLFDTFGISTTQNISIEDIALAYSSPDPDE